MKIAGVDELFLETITDSVPAIDHFTDSVLSKLDEEELEDALTGQNDSDAAAEEDWSRIHP